MNMARIAAFMLIVIAPLSRAQEEGGFVQNFGLEVPQEAAPVKGQDGAVADSPDADPELGKFAKSYFYAYRHGDIGSLRALVSPESQHCLDAAESNYFQQELSRSTHTGKINTLKWKVLDSEDSYPSSALFDPSQNPGDAQNLNSVQNSSSTQNSDRQMEISWKEEAATVAHTVLVTEGNGRYYIKAPCSGSGQHYNGGAQ